MLSLNNNLEEPQETIGEDFFTERKKLENARHELEIMKERIILEAQQEAENILNQAQMEAASIVELAQSEALQVKETALQQGLEEGKAEGLRLAEAESTDYLRQAKMTLENAYVEKEKLIANSEEEIVLLTLDIAQKVIKKEVALGHEVILQIVQEAIKKAAHREKVIIRVNALDLEAVEGQRPLLREKSGSQDLIILPDPTVQPGGCVLETDLGTVDARIDTQFKQIEECLLKIAKEKD